MRRSTFVILGVFAFVLILSTFLIRGTTRLIIGDRVSLLLALPVAVVSLLLVVTLIGVVILHLVGIRPIQNDIDSGH